MKSFLNINPDSEFHLNNLPFGIFHLKSEDPQKARCATRLGDLVIDLAYLENHNFLNLGQAQQVFNHATLNSFIELGKTSWSQTRLLLTSLFTDKSPFSCDWSTHAPLVSHSIDQCVMLLPVQIGDYTDFYSSRDHAYNVGVMFRGPENALQPNWLWMPVGYHGRASSVVVSPATFSRPSGQTKGPNDAQPKFEKSKKIDFELEVGMIVGKSNKLGQPIDIKQAEDHIFGFVLLNDVSARDIQNWEYVPLGPFVAKNFITVISPWVVTAEALKRTYKPLEPQNPAPLDYLNDPHYGSYDIELDVVLKTKLSPVEHLISKSNMKYLYWSFNQQIAHHTVTGCNMKVGDLLGTGTISGKDKKEFGSFLELSWNGKDPMSLEGGETRTFWENDDTLILKGHAVVDGQKIGFGDCVTKMTE